MAKTAFFKPSILQDNHYKSAEKEGSINDVKHSKNLIVVDLELNTKVIACFPNKDTLK